MHTFSRQFRSVTTSIRGRGLTDMPMMPWYVIPRPGEGGGGAGRKGHECSDKTPFYLPDTSQCLHGRCRNPIADCPGCVVVRHNFRIPVRLRCDVQRPSGSTAHWRSHVSATNLQSLHAVVSLASENYCLTEPPLRKFFDRS